MSTQGRPEIETPDATGLRLGIAATRWNAEIVEVLLERAVLAAERAGVAEPTTRTTT